MDKHVALWLLGIAVVPFLGWSIYVTICLRELLQITSKLLVMHESPDKYGFGTGNMKHVIEENTRAIAALTHYIKWFVREQTGKTPPPPLEQ